MALTPPALRGLALADIDRANIGNAKIEGLTDDLHLDGTKYNTCQSIFFVTYILFEIPGLFLVSLLLLWKKRRRR